MSDEITFTREQLEIELLKRRNSHFEKALDCIESNQRWLLGAMSAGFSALFSLMTCGFKWIT